MQQCSVCHSPDVQEINAALKSGVADREVERRFPSVTRASLSRHRRNHLSVGADDPTAGKALVPEVLPALPPGKSKASAETSDGEPSFENKKAIDQQRAVCTATWRLIEKALKKGNLGIATSNLRNMTEAIKSLGAMTGELQKDSHNISVNINSRAAWEGSSQSVLRWALARHVNATFSFDPQAIENLRLLAEGPCPDCQRYGCAHDLL